MNHKIIDRWVKTCQKWKKSAKMDHIFKKKGKSTKIVKEILENQQLLTKNSTKTNKDWKKFIKKLKRVEIYQNNEKKIVANKVKVGKNFWKLIKNHEKIFVKDVEIG